MGFFSPLFHWSIVNNGLTSLWTFKKKFNCSEFKADYITDGVLVLRKYSYHNADASTTVKSFKTVLTVKNWQIYKFSCL